MSLRIGVIPGDGIGPEVMETTLGVLRAAGVDFTTTTFDVSADRFLRDGHVLDEADVAGMRECDAILKGPLGPAIGDTRVPGGTVERGIICGCAASSTSTSTSARSTATARTSSSSGRTPRAPNAGEGGFLRKGTDFEIATQGSVNTRMGVERCIRYAFALARSRPRKHLTLVHKTNVLTFAGDLWQRVFDIVAAEYPDVTTAYNHIDAACIYLVESPRALRRDRHRQPVRRHHHRPRGSRDRRRGLRRHREPQPVPHRTVDVRAGARVRARRRRDRQRQRQLTNPFGRS